MTPVDQRILPDPQRGNGHDADGNAGDCQRAAVASILELPLDEVPHFVAYPHPEHDPLADEWGPRWWREQRRWLRTRGLDCYPCEGDALTEALHGEAGIQWTGHVVAAGPSPRGPFGHTCVAVFDGLRGPGDRLMLVHDPHPSRAFFDGAREPYALDVIMTEWGAQLPPDEPEAAS